MNIILFSFLLRCAGEASAAEGGGDVRSHQSHCSPIHAEKEEKERPTMNIRA